MFAGIITGIGKIQRVTPLAHEENQQEPHGYHLTIEAPPHYLEDVQLGDSIALNGACMTVTSLDVQKNCFTVDISVQSLCKTTGLDQPDNRINLEKAMRMEDRLGGHLVSGHVDGVGTVQQMTQVGESWLLEVLAPPEMGRFFAYKGSATVNGVSLTVNQVQDIDGKGTVISINLIPHTVQHTTLGELQAGSQVNLEIDLIARYVERMLALTSVSK